MAGSHQFLARAVECGCIIVLATFFFPFIISPLARLVPPDHKNSGSGRLRTAAMQVVLFGVYVSLWMLTWGRKNNRRNPYPMANAIHQLAINVLAINLISQIAAILLGGRFSHTIPMLTLMLGACLIVSGMFAQIIREYRERR